jgi:hypothetical protein
MERRSAQEDLIKSSKSQEGEMTDVGFPKTGGVTGVQGQNPSQNAGPPTNRCSKARNAGQARFTTSWTRKLLNLFNITIEFRPPKAIANSFLGQLWRRGAHYNTDATLLALMKDTYLKVKPELKTLSKDEASRLRKNLLNHGELPRAIAAVRRGLEECPDAPHKTRSMGELDALMTNLKNTFDTLSEKTGETGTDERYNKRKQDRLERVLWANAANQSIEACNSNTATPEDLKNLYRFCLLKAGHPLEESNVRAFGTEIGAAPVMARRMAQRSLMEAMKVETRKDAAKTNIDLAWRTLKRAPEELYSACLVKAGRKVEEADLREFGAEFMTAPPEKRREALGFLAEAMEEHATKDDTRTNIDLALRTLMSVEKPPWTFESLPQVDNRMVARAALADIANQFADCSDAEFDNAVASKLRMAELPWTHAAEFLKHLEGVALNGRPAIVYKAIQEFVDHKAIEAINSIMLRNRKAETIEVEEAEGVIKEALRIDGRTGRTVESYVDLFMSASMETRDSVLISIASAIRSKNRFDAWFALNKLEQT